MSANSDKIKGKAKQIEGKLTGDKVRMTEGTMQRAKGDVEGALTSFGRTVKKSVRRAKAGIRKAGRTRGR